MLGMSSINNSDVEQRLLEEFGSLGKEITKREFIQLPSQIGEPLLPAQTLWEVLGSMMHNGRGVIYKQKAVYLFLGS